MKTRIGLMGTALFIFCASLAHANFQISYSLNGGGAINCANSASNLSATCFSTSTNIGGGVSIFTLQGTSNSPGTASLGFQTGSLTQITTGAAPATLDIWVAAQGFTSPSTPPAISYESSLTLIPTTGTGSVSLESCVDTSNGTAPPLGTFCSAPAATLTNGPLAYNDAISAASNSFGTINTLTATPYSLSQEIVLSLGANTVLQIQTRQLLTPTPEPAALALLGTTLLGAAFLLRRKKLSKSR